MNYHELTRRLTRLGCTLDRRTRGSHEIWINPAKKTRTTIPNWGSHELKTGTITGILRDLGISKDEFDKR